MASLTSLQPKNNMQSSTESKSKQSLKQTTIDLVGGILCNICHSTFATKKGYDSHYVNHGNVTDIIYTCNICFKDIIGYPSFRGHCYTNHVIKDRYKCEHCSKQFSKIAILKEHINIVHKFRCPSCSKEFPTKKELQLHQIIHNDLDQPPYKCKTCKTEIDTVDDCKEHVKLHVECYYYCPICNENIPEKAHAIDHFKQHFGDQYNDEKVNEMEIPISSEETFIEEIGGIFCEFCSSVLKNRVDFDAHFSCKHGDKDIVYMCVVCGNTFEKYSVFYNHCYNHSMKNRYECQICQKSFPRLSLLATHAAVCQQARASNVKPFACTVCEHRFACESRWRAHLRDVHGLHRVPCPHAGCDQVFDTPKQLIFHQQIHNISIKHYCSQCRLGLTNLTTCQRHMELHKKKVYNCPVCSRNYKEKYVLMNHVSQHFETVLHLCKVCGKVYNARNRLVEHMKSHANVKSHTCKYCDKSFTKQHQLDQHLNTHTGSKPHKCPVCIKTFASQPNLRKHVRRMHQEMNIHIQNTIANCKEGVEEEGSAIEPAVDEDDEVSTDDIKDDIDEPLSNTDEQISSVDDQRSNTDTIAYIAHHSDNTDCPSDIEDANASIDFANVKLETYIFNVDYDSAIEVDSIPSIPDGKDLFNSNSEVNAPMETHLFSGTTEDNCLVGKPNENSGENTAHGKDLFDGNDENTQPVDILEYIADMPENNFLFVPVVAQEPLGPSANAAQPPVELEYPCEYGPEFSSGLAAGGSGFVDLDDHILPHIDPMLTIKNETCDKMYVQMQNNQPAYDDYNVTVEATDYENLPKWEPPIITKLYDEYAYGFGDMTDAGRLSIMNTDIF